LNILAPFAFCHTSVCNIRYATLKSRKIWKIER